MYVETQRSGRSESEDGLDKNPLSCRKISPLLAGFAVLLQYSSFLVFQFLIFDVTKIGFLLVLIYLIWVSMSIACSFLGLRSSDKKNHVDQVARDGALIPLRD